MCLVALLVSFLTVVELNCENLFDTVDDSLKRDESFLPASNYHWTPNRYWRKLNRIGQAILSCGMLDSLQVVPDLVALTEVENDSVMRDLTCRSLLRSFRVIRCTSLWCMRPVVPAASGLHALIGCMWPGTCAMQSTRCAPPRLRPVL